MSSYRNVDGLSRKKYHFVWRGNKTAFSIKTLRATELFQEQSVEGILNVMLVLILA